MKANQKTLFIFEEYLNKECLNIIKKHNNSNFLIEKGILKKSIKCITDKIFYEKYNRVIIMFGRSTLSVQRANTLKRALSKTNKKIYVFDWKKPLYERLGKSFFLHEKIQCVNDITNRQILFFLKNDFLFPR